METSAYRFKKTGVIALLGASVMWAIEPVLAKLSYESAHFTQTLTVRALVVALTALLYALVTDRNRLRVTRKQLPKLVYIGLVGTVVADLAYFYALTRVPVLNAVLIGHMQPVFVVLIGFLVLKEDRLTRFDYLGIAVLLASGLLVSTRTTGNLSSLRLGTFGDLVVLLATFAWATAGIVMRKYLRGMNAGTITFYRFATASCVFLAYSLCTSTLRVSSIYQILVGIVVGVGYILYYEGLKKIKAAQASALELSTPFFATLLGFFILGETVTAMQILGIALLFAGIYFISRKEEVPF